MQKIFLFKKILKRKGLIFPTLAILLIFLIARPSFLPLIGKKETAVKTAKVKKGDIESSVSGSGKIKSKNEATLKFGVSGKVFSITVKEGDFVKQGDLIASLDASSYLASLRQTQQDVNSADAVLSQIYDDQKKYSAAENFDQKIKRTNAETTKNKAYDAMKKAQRDLASTAIYAPFDGTVASVGAVAGQEVSVTSEISKLVDGQNYDFVTEVDETEIGKVSSGQKAEIKLDAFPDQTITTAVSRIAPVSKTTSTGSTAFEVTLILLNESKYLIGMNGEAKIVTAHAQNALIIPLDALVEDKYAWVKSGNEFGKKEIQKGIESDLETEVIEGVEDNQEVAVSGFDQINRKNLFQKLLKLK